MSSFRKHFIIPETDAPNPGSRLYFGLMVLCISFFMLPLGIFLHHQTESAFWKNFILAAFWLSAPVMKVASVGIMGKPTYLWIKSKFLRLFLHVVKPYHNNKLRYNIGLIMFCVPFIPNYFMAYAPRIFEHDFTFRMILNVTTEVIFITSLFILGGDFWDKLKALFVFTAKVSFPDDEEEKSPAE